MKNKIISILCIFILISCSLINVCFAFTVNNNYTISDKVFETLNNYISVDENGCYYQTGSTVRTTATNYMVWAGKYNCFLFYFFDNGYIDGNNFVWTSNASSSQRNHFWVEIYENGTFHSKCNPEYKSGANGIWYPYFVTCTTSLYNSDGTIFYEAPVIEPEIIYPGISNTAEDLSTGTYNNILILPGTFSNNENIGFGIYKNSEDVSDIYSTNPVFSTMLVKESRYYKSVTSGDITEFWYEIPRSNLDINFKNGETYTFVLLLDGSPIQEIQVTIGGLTEEDILNNNFDNLQSSVVNSNKELQETIKESNKELQSSIDKQTEAIEENNKTNKNIFEKIGEILSYLNPFSENFFAYKLVELIVDGLKSLFVPGEDFFSTYFDELNSWFSDRLGFLYYPLELLFDLLDRFLNIDFAEPIINIPDIKEPFTNVTLIKPISFNFNDLLSNKTLKNVHDIYFIIVDAVIYIGLVTLLYRKYEEVMTK